MDGNGSGSSKWQLIKHDFPLLVTENIDKTKTTHVPQIIDKL